MWCHSKPPISLSPPPPPPLSVRKSKWVKVSHGRLGLTLQANFKKSRKAIEKVARNSPRWAFGVLTFVFCCHWRRSTIPSACAAAQLVCCKSTWRCWILKVLRVRWQMGGRFDSQRRETMFALSYRIEIKIKKKKKPVMNDIASFLKLSLYLHLLGRLGLVPNAIFFFLATPFSQIGVVTPTDQTLSRGNAVTILRRLLPVGATKSRG